MGEKTNEEGSETRSDTVEKTSTLDRSTSVSEPAADSQPELTDETHSNSKEEEPSADRLASPEDSTREPVFDGQVDEDELENETCGFCKFMKAGPCGTVFKEWEGCIEKSRGDGDDYVESCLDSTRLLKECMDKNAEYYNPVLELDKQEAEKREAENSEDPSTSSKVSENAAKDAETKMEEVSPIQE
mmetsp:Transcript_26501/g.36599  ORF Transcript_26501/g.36599 Transcript_26501/m.36599 type:complete len:187 (-) Transcript_26501:191-751(-)|eukprot:CAMPEP_0196591572 /NCGR_PEP_ID=MMETSP1081-20130531/70097_1 /TAXON_ID=36882 /ORGANISM="Pyramimonas amylifera, Strain CCMP720" /LENGTH=186 /DNA_ID=CAMNT_0041914969 /DNA_START=206 /DNA_END=766 /DNA_ORIENTATION=+